MLESAGAGVAADESVTGIPAGVEGTGGVLKSGLT
jgi:hypothetical protein